LPRLHGEKRRRAGDPRKENVDDLTRAPGIYGPDKAKWPDPYARQKKAEKHGTFRAGGRGVRRTQLQALGLLVYQGRERKMEKAMVGKVLLGERL